MPLRAAAPDRIACIPLEGPDGHVRVVSCARCLHGGEAFAREVEGDGLMSMRNSTSDVVWRLDWADDDAARCRKTRSKRKLRVV